MKRHAWNSDLTTVLGKRLLIDRRVPLPQHHIVFIGARHMLEQYLLFLELVMPV